MESNEHPLRKPCILIVDDDMCNLKLFAMLLAKRGYRVLLATDAQLGLDIARRERPDLIIMDIQLPDGSGLEATRSLKADQDTRGIPVLITTAFLIDEGVVRESGCDGYLPKPFPLGRFLPVVISLLDCSAAAARKTNAAA
jgi:two-component system cell cycle response regulator DivK